MIFTTVLSDNCRLGQQQIKAGTSRATSSAAETNPVAKSTRGTMRRRGVPSTCEDLALSRRNQLPAPPFHGTEHTPLLVVPAPEMLRCFVSLTTDLHGLLSQPTTRGLHPYRKPRTRGATSLPSAAGLPRGTAAHGARESPPHMRLARTSVFSKLTMEQGQLKGKKVRVMHHKRGFILLFCQLQFGFNYLW